MEETKNLPSMWKVLLVLGGFLGLAFTFTTVGISIHLAIFSGWFLAIAVGLSLGYSYEDLEEAITGGIHEGMNAVIILLAVGALVGTWISGGIVPSIIYYGLKTIHPSFFFLTTMIILTLTSLSTGTSWGAVGTAGIAMMGVGAGLGVPEAMTAGAVLSGAYFGDKLSPLSDSTVLTASMSNIDVIDHVKGMFPASVVGYIISAIGFTILGFNVGGGSTDLSRVNKVLNTMEDLYNINLFFIIPLIIVIGLLVMDKPSIPVITFGSVLGIIWGIGFQGLEPIKAIGTAWAQIPKDTGMVFIDNILSRGGMESMLWSVGVIIFGLGFGGLLDKIGILEAIAEKLEKGIKTGGSLTVTTLLVGFFGNLFGSAMYVSLILTPKIMEKKYDKLGYDRRVLSRNTEFGGTLTSAMIPWSDNGIYMAGILGVSTLDYLPYMWLAFACIGVTILYGYTGMFMYRTDDADDADDAAAV